MVSAVCSRASTASRSWPRRRTAARDHGPHLVLLGVALPELNGLDACAKITQRFPDVAVLILSTYSNEEHVLRALRNGARGYVLKSASAAELEVAIRAAARGDRYLSPEVSGHVIDAYLEVGAVRSPLDTLTPRQREVLQLVSEGLTTRKIAERLGIDPKTVETHRTNLMRTLGLHDVVSVVRFAIRNGLVLEAPPAGRARPGRAPERVRLTGPSTRSHHDPVRATLPLPPVPARTAAARGLR